MSRAERHIAHDDLVVRREEVERDIEHAHRVRDRALAQGQITDRKENVVRRAVRWWDDLHERNHVVEHLQRLFGSMG